MLPRLSGQRLPVSARLLGVLRLLIDRRLGVFAADPAIDKVLTLGGMNMLAGGANSTNVTTLFVMLKP